MKAIYKGLERREAPAFNFKYQSQKSFCAFRVFGHKHEHLIPPGHEVIENRALYEPDLPLCDTLYPTYMPDVEYQVSPEERVAVEERLINTEDPLELFLQRQESFLQSQN